MQDKYCEWQCVLNTSPPRNQAQKQLAAFTLVSLHPLSAFCARSNALCNSLSLFLRAAGAKATGDLQAQLRARPMEVGCRAHHLWSLSFSLSLSPPPPPPLSLSLPFLLFRSLSLSLSLFSSLPYSLFLSHSLYRPRAAHCIRYLSLALSLTHTHSLSLSFSLSLTHSLSFSLSLPLHPLNLPSSLPLSPSFCPPPHPPLSLFLSITLSLFLSLPLSLSLCLELITSALFRAIFFLHNLAQRKLLHGRVALVIVNCGCRILKRKHV